MDHLEPRGSFRAQERTQEEEGEYCGGHTGKVPGLGSFQRRQDIEEWEVCCFQVVENKRRTRPSTEGQPELQGWGCGNIPLSAGQTHLLTPRLYRWLCSHRQWAVAASFVASDSRVRGSLKAINHTRLSLITSSVLRSSLRPFFSFLKFLSDNSMISYL